MAVYCGVALCVSTAVGGVYNNQLLPDKHQFVSLKILDEPTMSHSLLVRRAGARCSIEGMNACSIFFF